MSGRCQTIETAPSSLAAGLQAALPGFPSRKTAQPDQPAKSAERRKLAAVMSALPFAPGNGPRGISMHILSRAIRVQPAGLFTRIRPDGQLKNVDFARKNRKLV